MSAQAVAIYELLRVNGIDDEPARRAAEAVDRTIQNQAVAGGKADARFVRKDDCHRRMENTPAGDNWDWLDVILIPMGVFFSLFPLFVILC